MRLRLPSARVAPRTRFTPPWRRSWRGVGARCSPVMTSPEDPSERASYRARDELHQAFASCTTRSGPGRHLSAIDVGIDATGELIVLVAVGVIRSRRS